jgi:hypothetical protein
MDDEIEVGNANAVVLDGEGICKATTTKWQQRKGQ